MDKATLTYLLPWKLQAAVVRGGEISTAFCPTPCPDPKLGQTTYQQALALLQYSKTKSRTRTEVAGAVAGVEFTRGPKDLKESYSEGVGVRANIHFQFL